MTAGVGFGVVAFEAGLVYWVLLLPCYVLTVGGARRLQINIVHACVHYRFFRVGWANVLLGEAASILVLTQDFQAYRCDHVFHHHGKGIATIDDPDMLLLYDLGIRPGLPKSLLWRRLLITLISPRFHIMFFAARLRSNFVTSPWHRRLAAAALWAAVLGTVTQAGVWGAFLVCWVVPAVPLMQASALLQFCCEHAWGRRRLPGESAAEHYGRVSFGRFCGEVPPQPACRRSAAWPPGLGDG